MMDPKEIDFSDVFKVNCRCFISVPDVKAP